MADPQQLPPRVQRELWAMRQQDAIGRMTAVRGYLDAVLSGHTTPHPGDLARAAGLLLYASGSLQDAEGYGQPATQLDVPPAGYGPEGTPTDGGTT